MAFGNEVKNTRNPEVFNYCHITVLSSCVQVRNFAMLPSG